MLIILDFISKYVENPWFHTTRCPLSLQGCRTLLDMQSQPLTPGDMQSHPHNPGGWPCEESSWQPTQCLLFVRAYWMGGNACVNIPAQRGISGSHTHTHRDTHRQRHTHIKRKTRTQRHTDTERHTQADRDSPTPTQTDTQTHTQTDRQPDRHTPTQWDKTVPGPFLQNQSHRQRKEGSSKIRLISTI